jgi:hypothetical protein
VFYEIGFNPDELMVDSTGIWFANFDNRTIWHWQPGETLQKVSLEGLPPLSPARTRTLAWRRPELASRSASREKG